MIKRTHLIQQEVDLTHLNTFRIPAKAKYFAEPQTREQLQEIITETAEHHSILVLGGGSNLLFVDDYSGLIIKPFLEEKTVIQKDQNYVWLRIGAGENWHETVCYCVEKGWGGIENLSLIPGLVGAAPIQNIGAYGVEFKDVFESLRAVEISTGKEKKFNKKDCNFGYRDSIFKQELKNEFVITDVTIKLDRKPRINSSYGAIQQKLDDKNITDPSIADISGIVTEIRRAKLPDPEKVPNAGSFFKNPIINNGRFEALLKEFPAMPHYKVGQNSTKIPAGWLIEQAGWKQKSTGNAGVHKEQALVIVNKNNASGQEILDLSKKIQNSIKNKFNINLIPEVNIIN